MKSYNWSTDAFLACYNSIKYDGVVNQEMLKIIADDLLALTTTPPNTEGTKLEEEVEFSDGSKYMLNTEYRESATVLSLELGLSVLATAELLQYAQHAVGYQIGTEFTDSGRIAFYTRMKYILNIVGFLASNRQLETLSELLSLGKFSGFAQELFEKVLESFLGVYTRLQKLNDLIDKQKAVGDLNSLSFVSAIKYSKAENFQIHELLGSLLFGLMNSYGTTLATASNLNKITEIVSKNLKDEDTFVLHYLPGMLQVVDPSSGGNDVEAIYKHIVAKLSLDYQKVTNTSSGGEIEVDISKSGLQPTEVVLYLITLTRFVTWCKEDDSRTSKYNFEKDILKYIEWTINYGAFEKLLSITAETRAAETLSTTFAYDFRSLLQRNFPSISALKLSYAGSAEILNIALSNNQTNAVSLFSKTELQVSQQFKDELIAPFFHFFFKEFISNSAIILTLLRDSEEDFLLSSTTRKEEEREKRRKELETRNGNDNDHDHRDHSNDQISEDDDSIDLDTIAARADLERFYLAFTYTYQNRSEICKLFWNQDDKGLNEMLGFISWGLTNNTSPLITSTFSVLIGSLTFAGEAAASKIWEVLVNNNSTIGLKKNDFSKISVDSISESLYYYINSMNTNFKEDLQLQNQQQRHLLLDLILPTNPGLRGHRKPSIGGITGNDDSSITTIVIELAEDSVVFVAGFMHLLRCIVSNLSKEGSEKSNKIKNQIFSRFQPIVCEFLKFDNLIISTKMALNNSKKQNEGASASIYISDENRVVLINLMLEFLGSFVDEDLVLRNQLWDILDRWAFNGGWPIEKSNDDLRSLQSTGDANTSSFTNNSTTNTTTTTSFTSYKSVRIVLYFQTSLTQLSQVSNFVNLIAKLLQPTNDENKAFRKYKLLYPADIGKDYRDIGIWPYIEYLMVEVFTKSTQIPDIDEKRSIQLPLINMICSSLKEIDWVFLNDIAPVAIKNSMLNLDLCIQPVDLSYHLLIKLHHSMAIMNYIFDERVYRTIVEVIQGDDEDQIEGGLEIVQLVLEIQDTFINRLLPILKDNVKPKREATTDKGFGSINAFNRFAGYGTNLSVALSTPRTIYDNIYYPKSIGLQGVSNFYEILLFNLPVVTKFALFVGSPRVGITNAAISLLKLISQSEFFNSKSSTLLNNDRLLTTFKAINESETIRYSFMKKLEKYVETEADLEVKYKVLDFLSTNIAKNEPSLSHFLLGYEIQGGRLLLKNNSNENTLLKSLLRLLDSSLESISNIDYQKGNINIIHLAPAKLSTMILEILVKLCRDKISSRVTLDFLRQDEASPLFTKLIECQPRIDLSTIWSTQPFNGDLQAKKTNKFIEDGSSTLALFFFIRQRNLTLQYLSLEFLYTSKMRSITRREYYIDILLNGNEFITGASRILSFLNILNFKFENFAISTYDKFENKYDLEIILQNAKQAGDMTSCGSILDFSIMEKIYKVMCKLAVSQLTTKEMKVSFGQEVMDEATKIAEFLTKYVIYNDFKAIQLSCLHLWVQLIQVLLTDGKMEKSKKTNFILEIFQIILPKINDYLEIDILFAEEFISLTVLLFDIYEKENQESGLGRLFPLFQTCVNGLLCSYLTPELRSDLYVLASKFLQKSFGNDEGLLKDLSSTIKSVDSRFVEILCSDALYAEGAPRITSLIFLESIIHLTSLSRDSFIFVIKNNFLSLLVRSLKRADEVLQSVSDADGENTTGGYSLNNLLYELTAFKSTIYLLLRIATTRSGASQLIQSELFPTLKASKFLSIDPDLGLNLKINGNNESAESVTVNLSLDTPLPLMDNSQEGNRGDISYFEFVVPVFQLINAVLISMGPSYKPGIIQGKDLMKHFHHLIVGIVKRDSLLERQDNSNKFNKVYAEDEISYLGLTELVKLITLLNSLVSEST